MKKKFNLENKTIIITGGASGIGKAIGLATDIINNFEKKHTIELILFLMFLLQNLLLWEQN